MKKQKSINKKSIIKGLFIFAVFVFGILILNLIGRYLIKEVTQEVAIEPEKKSEIKNNSLLGTKAPYFELVDTNNTKVRLSDFIGSPLVITFWTTWNDNSTNQIKIIDDYLAKNNESLFKIIAINNQEDRSIVNNFIKRSGYRVKILLDEKGLLSETYYLKVLPISYFLDKNGIIKDMGFGVLNENQFKEKAEKIIR